MTAQRIDFKHVRQHADFARVLADYGLELSKDGTRPDQHKCLCPFHEDTKPSLKVNTAKNIYHCFACEAKGNVLDFVMAMDDIGIRPAAKKVAVLCGISPAPGGTVGNAKGKPTKSAAKARQAKPETPAPTAAADEEPPHNAPLTFTLQLTQPPALLAWLETRGIDANAIKTFGLGQVSKRSKSIGERLAIPIHNEAGELIAYCGRHIGEELPEDTPKYVLPKGFHKDIEIFNLHRLPVEPVYVVLFESYFSVMRHADNLQCISTFGRSISEAQIALLKDTGCKRVLIAFDGDEPGRAGAATVASQLATSFWTRIVELPEDVKPHHLAWEDLRPILRDVWV